VTVERAFNPEQPLINLTDGTPVYEFQDFLVEVDTAVQDARLVSVWGGVSGSISDQSDLVAGGKFLDSLVGESNVTQHEGALSIDGSQVTSTVRNEATDPYTLVIGDANEVIRFTTAGAAVTVPQEASINFPVGTTVTLRQAGTGTLSLTTTGLTINGTLPSWAQHVEVTLRKVGADEWDVV
jgi:hypothetical protein